MERYNSFEELKNSDTKKSNSGVVKNEESLIKFFKLLRENLIDNNTDMKYMKYKKNIKTKR